MVLAKPMTVDEFEAMPEDGKRYELVRGVLREMPAGGGWHGEIGADFIIDLGGYVRAHQLGKIYNADTGFRIFPDHETVYQPDVAFVRADRLPSLSERRRILRIRPDLVVEVVSPTDRMSDVLDKVADYLRAGVPLVVVAEPDRRVVTTYRPNRDPRELAEDREFDGEEIVPGFRLVVADIFRE
jgi:Uma2 family endonuclease